MEKSADPILRSIIRELRLNHRCHTIVLYGSRARGLATSTSDYDVIGIRRQGQKFRIAKRQKGFYWDVFVYAEKDLRTLGDQHFAWKNAIVLHDENGYGIALLRRLRRHLQKPHKPQPRDEIRAMKVWAQKELDRCRKTDIQGLYRRAEFQAALVGDYFFMRQQRYWGPKEGFAWILQNDPETFKLIRRALRSPNSLPFLKSAAARVYGTPLGGS